MMPTTCCSLLGFLALIKAAHGQMPSDSCPGSATLPRRYFGPDCRYHCHCAHYDQCDPIKGSCANGGCSEGYTGTACQYVNSAYKAVIEPPNFPSLGGAIELAKIVDGNVENCFIEAINNGSGRTLSVVIRRATWADVITVLLFNDFVNAGLTAKAEELELTYFDHNNKSTIVLQPNNVDLNGSLMYYRLQPTRVSRVQIRAPKQAPLAICEIAVQSGRNLAANKLRAPQLNFTVDGDLKTCYNTPLPINGTGGYFTVPLGADIDVWSVVLKNETGNVIINATLPNGQKRQLSTIPEGNSLLMVEPVRANNITLWSAVNQLPPFCEIEILGDCPEGKYGWRCEEDCQCGRKPCDKVWGHCIGNDAKNESANCPDGWYGEDCRSECPANCKSKQCNRNTGVCLMGCKEGFVGNKCDSCNNGMYGKDCMQRCSTNCKDNVCDQTTGQCRQGCTEGASGSECGNPTSGAGVQRTSWVLAVICGVLLATYM